MSERMDYIKKHMANNSVVLGYSETDECSEVAVIAGRRIPFCDRFVKKYVLFWRCKGDEFPFKLSYSMLMDDKLTELAIKSAKDRCLV